MKTGTLVKLLLFKLNLENKEVYRYGIVMPHPDGFTEDFTKVMWQPSKDIPFGKGRNQCEIVLTNRLEVVCSEGAA